MNIPEGGEIENHQVLRWICKHGKRNASVKTIPVKLDVYLNPEKYLGCACRQSDLDEVKKLTNKP